MRKMEQLKVLHVIDHVGFGGAQRVVKELLDRWNNNNIKLFCYALRRSNNEFEFNNKHIFFSSNHKSKYSVLSFLELKNFIKTNNIKVLHLQLIKSIIFGVLLKTFYYKNLKIIVHEQGKIFRNNFWYNYFLNLFQDKIDLFIAISEATKRKLIENAKIKEDKIKLLYNFVDLEHFNSQQIKINRSEKRKKLGLNNEDFVLGFAGRLEERKGCRDLILALEKLKHHKNIKLLIAGDGPKKEEYIKLVNKLWLNKSIFFLGFVPDIKRFYSLIDCLVIPSHWEPLGIVALEAQSMGVPVIAANVEGLNEVVSDKKTGLLFEPKNEKDLAEKIMLLYDNRKLREYITKSTLESVKKYSLENFLTAMFDIYNEVKMENDYRKSGNI